MGGGKKEHQRKGRGKEWAGIERKRKGEKMKRKEEEKRSIELRRGGKETGSSVAGGEGEAMDSCIRGQRKRETMR